MPHKSSNPDLRGKLLDVVHALHTTKMHYYTQLTQLFKKTRAVTSIWWCTASLWR